MEDFSREGISWQKILQMFRLFWPKNTKTLVRLNKFTEFDVDKIFQDKGVQIKGIILDVDGCISHNHSKIIPENIKHLNTLLNRGIKIVCYSNMKWSERYKDLPKEIKVLTNIPAKPSYIGFKKAVEQLNCSKSNVVMIGDSYITDGGAIHYGINFVYVKPIKDKSKNFHEFFQNLIRDFFNGLAKFHSLIRACVKQK